MNTLVDYLSETSRGIATSVASAGKSAAAKIAGAAAPLPPGKAFAAVLEKAGAAESQRRKEAEEGAAGLVSNALILPILKQVRRSSFGENTPFSPGNGEKMFGPQFDMQIADHIAHSPRLGVTRALTERMLKTRPANKGSRLNLHG